MIRFKVRRSIKQYSPMKPIKRDFKLWCIADNSGYVYRFEIYAGKRTNNECQQNAIRGLGGNVVVLLTCNLIARNHRVFVDNYFSNIPLLEELQGKRILACGTIHSNKKDFPPLAEDKMLNRGDFNYRSTSSATTVFIWKDLKAVHFISNYHAVQMNSVQRKEKDGSKLLFPVRKLSRTTTKTWAELINMTCCANYMASIKKTLNGGIDFFWHA